MNLYYLSMAEDYEESNGWPDQQKFLVCANNETEVRKVVRESMSYLDDESFNKYHETTLSKMDFTYTGDETEPFVFISID